MLILQVRARARENDLVLKAFTVLTRKDALARQLSRLDVQQVCPCTHPSSPYIALGRSCQQPEAVAHQNTPARRLTGSHRMLCRCSLD